VTYDRFSYDYSAATPPILEPPSCAKGLSALQIGHRFFQTSPQVLELEATAYARLASLSLSPVFGSTLRFATENATQRTETFPYLGQLELTGHDPQSLSFVARLSGVTFEAVLQAELVPAANSRLQVRLQIYPRAADPGVSLGVAALSSMFWKRDADTPDAAGDEAHDADQLFVKSADGTETTAPLENPELSLASDPWQRRTFAGPFDTISLLQTERDPQKYAAYEPARYADRPSYTIGEITASVPLSAELAIVHASDEYIDNVVLDLVADTNGAAVPIEVSYVLSAEAN
jgi:glucan biosynthesis protein